MRTPGRFALATLAGTVCVVVIALAVAGCGSSELRDRYIAERMIWQARREAQRLNLGQQVMQQADIDRARAAYAAIVKRFPPETWSGRQGEEAKRIRGITGEALLTEAQLLARARQGADAHERLALIRRWFAADEVAVRAAYLEAAILGAEKKPSEAARTVAAVWREHAPVLDDGSANPAVIQAPLYTASWYAQAGDTTAMKRAIDDGRAYYDGLIRDHPGTPVAFYARTSLLAIQKALGLWDQAVANLGAIAADSVLQAGDKNGVTAVLVRLQAATIQAGPLKDPATALRQIASIERAGLPEDVKPSFRIAQAGILSDAGQATAALDTLAEVLEANASSMDICARAYYARGAIYEQLGDWDHALTEYRTLVAKYPQSRLGLQTPLAIVSRFEARGEHERGAAELSQAISDYRRVIEQNPQSGQAVTARGFMAQAYEVSGQWDEAAAAYGDVASATRGTPAGAEALLRQASIYARVLHKPDEAAKLLKEVISLYPDTGASDAARTGLAALGRGASPSPSPASPAPPASSPADRTSPPGASASTPGTP